MSTSALLGKRTNDYENDPNLTFLEILLKDESAEQKLQRHINKVAIATEEYEKIFLQVIKQEYQNLGDKPFHYFLENIKVDLQAYSAQEIIDYSNYKKICKLIRKIENLQDKIKVCIVKEETPNTQR